MTQAAGGTLERLARAYLRADRRAGEDEQSHAKHAAAVTAYGRLRRAFLQEGGSEDQLGGFIETQREQYDG